MYALVKTGVTWKGEIILSQNLVRFTVGVNMNESHVNMKTSIIKSWIFFNFYYIIYLRIFFLWMICAKFLPCLRIKSSTLRFLNHDTASSLLCTPVNLSIIINEKSSQWMKPQYLIPKLSQGLETKFTRNISSPNKVLNNNM